MSKELLLYVGTYTELTSFGKGIVFQGKGEGIHCYAFESETGALEPRPTAKGVKNPSYLNFHPSGRFLYAVNEQDEFEGKASGAVSSFAVDPETGALSPLDQKPTGGTHPCYVGVDKTGRYVFVANYSSGSVCVLPVQEDGSLGEPTDFIQFEGSGPNVERQQGPHAHSVMLDEENGFAFVTDLGSDRLMVYRLDNDTGILSSLEPPWLAHPPLTGLVRASHPGSS